MENSSICGVPVSLVVLSQNRLGFHAQGGFLPAFVSCVSYGYGEWLEMEKKLLTSSDNEIVSHGHIASAEYLKHIGETVKLESPLKENFQKCEECMGRYPSICMHLRSNSDSFLTCEILLENGSLVCLSLSSSGNLLACKMESSASQIPMVAAFRSSSGYLCDNFFIESSPNLPHLVIISRREEEVQQDFSSSVPSRALQMRRSGRFLSRVSDRSKQSAFSVPVGFANSKIVLNEDQDWGVSFGDTAIILYRVVQQKKDDGEVNWLLEYSSSLSLHDHSVTGSKINNPVSHFPMKCVLQKAAVDSQMVGTWTSTCWMPSSQPPPSVNLTPAMPHNIMTCHQNGQTLNRSESDHPERVEQQNHEWRVVSCSFLSANSLIYVGNNETSGGPVFLSILERVTTINRDQALDVLKCVSDSDHLRACVNSDERLNCVKIHVNLYSVDNTGHFIRFASFPLTTEYAQTALPGNKCLAVELSPDYSKCVVCTSSGIMGVFSLLCGECISIRYMARLDFDHGYTSFKDVSVRPPLLIRWHPSETMITVITNVSSNQCTEHSSNPVINLFDCTLQPVSAWLTSPAGIGVVSDKSYIDLTEIFGQLGCMEVIDAAWHPEIRQFSGPGAHLFVLLLARGPVIVCRFSLKNLTAFEWVSERMRLNEVSQAIHVVKSIRNVPELIMAITRISDSLLPKLHKTAQNIDTENDDIKRNNDSSSALAALESVLDYLLTKSEWYCEHKGWIPAVFPITTLRQYTLFLSKRCILKLISIGNIDTAFTMLMRLSDWVFPMKFFSSDFSIDEMDMGVVKNEIGCIRDLHVDLMSWANKWELPSVSLATGDCLIKTEAKIKQVLSNSVCNDDEDWDKVMELANTVGLGTVEFNVGAPFDGIVWEEKQPIRERVEEEQPIRERVEEEQPIRERVEPIQPIRERVEDEQPIRERVEEEQPIRERVEPIQPIRERVEKEQPIRERVEDEQPIRERVEPILPIRERVEPIQPIRERVEEELQSTPMVNTLGKLSELAKKLSQFNAQLEPLVSTYSPNTNTNTNTHDNNSDFDFEFLPFAFIDSDSDSSEGIIEYHSVFVDDYSDT